MKPLSLTVRWQRLLLFVLPLLLGALLLLVLLKTRPPLPQVETRQPPSAQPVFKVSQRPLQAEVMGHGSLQADQIWQAMTQVEGELTYLAPLRSGQTVTAGTTLLRVDGQNYQLNLEQARAERQRLHSELLQLQTRSENERALLALEKQNLQLAQQAVQRMQNLQAEDVLALSQLEQEQRNLLRQQYQIQLLENSLKLIGPARQSLEASLKAVQIQEERAKLQLKHTDLKAPFDGVLANFRLQKGQFVATRQVLFEIYGNQRMKLDVALPLFKLQQLLSAEDYQQVLKELNQSAGIQTLSQKLQFDVRFPGNMDSASKVSIPGKLVAWRESSESSTRSLVFTVVLDKQQADQSNQVPLLKGQYAEVHFKALQPRSVLMIPRRALHQQQVYVLDTAFRLQLRTVEVGLSQGDWVQINKGLTVGEQVLLALPDPLIPGMRIDPVIQADIALS